MTALTESSLRVLSNTSAYPQSGRHPERRRRQRPRLRRPLPTATRRRLGHRREPDGPGLVVPCLLRRAQRSEPRLSARAARHRRLAVDGPRRRRSGRAGLRLSRPVRRQPADRREGPERRSAASRSAATWTCAQPDGRRYPRTSHRASRERSSRRPPRSSASRTSGAAATSTGRPAAASTAPASCSTPPTKPPADASDSPTTRATRSTLGTGVPWADKQARRPDLLQLPRRRRPPPRRDLRRRRQDPPRATDRRCRPLRDDRRVLGRGHDRAKSAVTGSGRPGPARPIERRESRSSRAA